ncbi:MAG: hypothetical protein M0Z53_06035 [Thermaerobacter sp.]|nr:hypothetical protein [Thermaerobacter sp.]
MVALTVQSPTGEQAMSAGLLAEAISAAGLDGWFYEHWRMGTWQLWWEDQLIWLGDYPDRAAWVDALLAAWWVQGGGCC